MENFNVLLNLYKMNPLKKSQVYKSFLNGILLPNRGNSALNNDSNESVFTKTKPTLSVKQLENIINASNSNNIIKHILLNIFLFFLETALGVDLGDQNLAENKSYSTAIDNIMDCFVSRFKNIFWHNDRLFNWSSKKKVLNQNLKIVHALSQKVKQLISSHPCRNYVL